MLLIVFFFENLIFLVWNQEINSKSQMVADNMGSAIFIRFSTKLRRTEKERGEKERMDEIKKERTKSLSQSKNDKVNTEIHPNSELRRETHTQNEAHIQPNLISIARFEFDSILLFHLTY